MGPCLCLCSQWEHCINFLHRICREGGGHVGVLGCSERHSQCQSWRASSLSPTIAPFGLLHQLLYTIMIIRCDQCRHLRCAQVDEISQESAAISLSASLVLLPNCLCGRKGSCLTRVVQPGGSSISPLEGMKR